MQGYLKKGFSFVWMTGIPLCFGLISVSVSFVPWFFGKGYEKVVPLLCVFSFLIISIGLSNILGTQYLIPTGRQNFYTITVVSGAVVNATFDFLLIPKFYSIGAAVASVAAETLIAILQIIILRKEIPLKIVFGTAKNYMIAGAVMFAVTFYIRKRVPTTISGTLLIVIVGALLYIGTLLILRDKFIFGYLTTFKKKISKRG